jgi:PilZ domain
MLNPAERRRKPALRGPRATASERRDPYGDRRESPRLPATLWVRPLGSRGPFQECTGNISLGGAYWQLREPVLATDFELSFHLPGGPADLTALAQVLRTRKGDDGYAVHARFVVIDLMAELALARFIDDSLQAHPFALATEPEHSGLLS